jgi:putative hydrolase of the HAD superfamily
MAIQHNVCAVLFDYGKVLSLPEDAAAWARLRSLTRLSEEALHRLYWAHRDAYDKGTLNGVTYWQTISREGGFSLDEAKMAALQAADVDLWGQSNEPMVAWARRLQERGIKTGILSNIGDAMETGLRKRFDWIGGFTHHTWSHRQKIAKPDAAIYQHAVEGLGCPAAEVLFIDDREENIHGAIAAGLQAILYTTHDAFVKTMRERSYGGLLDN